MLSSAGRHREIDGLRGVAIVPVVLYHAGWSVLPGGFVGVDVFFVISGYLITRILAGEIQDQTFSLGRFYERRARRILPALFAVLLTTTALAVTILFPSDLRRYFASLVWTVTSAANVFFYQRTGYFEASANSYALLHTWSLAVEEQFYLVFPVILWLASRFFGRYAIWVVVLIGLVSLAMSIFWPVDDEAFAFYLPFTRAWELMAGSLVALGALRDIGSQPWRETVAAACLAALLWTILFLHEGGSFPGWIAAVPVLGTVGLIRWSKGTKVGALLRHPLMVGTGLISFSLYLWHWPLLVLTSYWLARPLTIWETTTLVVIAMALAALSWKFVEQPFRDKSFLSQRTIYGLSIVCIAAFVALGLAGDYSKGLPARMPVAVRRLAAAATDISPKRKQCHGAKPGTAGCALGADVRPTIAVWSDSHGVELSFALGEIAKASNRSVLQLSSSGCPPTLNFNPPTRANCDDRNKTILSYLVEHSEISTVIVEASRNDDTEMYLDQTFPGLEFAISQLRALGKTVVLVYPIPHAPQDVPQYLARQQWRGGTLAGSIFTLAEFQQGLAQTLARMDQLATQYGLVTIHPTDVYCPEGECKRYLSDVVLYFDNNHPSLSGARLIAPLFASVIASAGTAH